MFKNRALLLDRDGVINQDDGYVGSVDRFVFLPGLFPFLRAVSDKGYRLAVLTNQSGVARGYFSADDFAKVTEHMRACLRREGIEIDLVLSCFEHRSGKVAALARDSFWRKPNPGMVLEARQRLRLDLARCVFLGDKASDMQAGLAAGVGLNLWLTREPDAPVPGAKIVGDYAQALEIVNGL